MQNLTIIINQGGKKIGGSRKFARVLSEALGAIVEMPKLRARSAAKEEESAGIAATFTAKQIAETLGIYSLSGKPHCQAVACIINEILSVGDEHKFITTMDYGTHIGVCARYDRHTLNAVWNWLYNNGFPTEIDASDRTYHITYTVI